jgi:hypothetical protein
VVQLFILLLTYIGRNSQYLIVSVGVFGGYYISNITLQTEVTSMEGRAYESGYPKLSKSKLLGRISVPRLNLYEGLLRRHRLLHPEQAYPFRCAHGHTCGDDHDLHDRDRVHDDAGHGLCVCFFWAS